MSTQETQVKNTDRNGQFDLEGFQIWQSDIQKQGIETVSFETVVDSQLSGLEKDKLVRDGKQGSWVSLQYDSQSRFIPINISTEVAEGSNLNITGEGWARVPSNTVINRDASGQVSITKPVVGG